MFAIRVSEEKGKKIGLEKLFKELIEELDSSNHFWCSAAQ
jgi:hypothetical protein